MSILFILQELMDRIGEEAGLEEVPLPCDQFRPHNRDFHWGPHRSHVGASADASPHCDRGLPGSFEGGIWEGKDMEMEPFLERAQVLG